MDEEGNVIAQNKSKNESEIQSNQADIAKLENATAELRVELNEFKEQMERGGASSKETGELVSKHSEDISRLEKLVEELEGKGKDASKQHDSFASMSQVDGKIKSVLEKLKNDNQMMWKETVNMAEKTFNEKGISQNMELMPSVLQGVTQLKTTINILEDKYGEGIMQPKP